MTENWAVDDVVVLTRDESDTFRAGDVGHVEHWEDGEGWVRFRGHAREDIDDAFLHIAPGLFCHAPPEIAEGYLREMKRYDYSDILVASAVTNESSKSALDHPAIDPVICRNIMDRLATVEREQGVRILFAVESGSRAWGMWSPDSDYDVRFVYVHHPSWYLSIHENRRDVIETPLDEIYDVNGWELRKALRLMIKPNAVVHEWLCSPICYQRHRESARQLLLFANQVFEKKTYAHHYVHLGLNQTRTFLDGRDEVSLKKYLYALRPALALLWLETNSSLPPPMNIDALMENLPLPEMVRDAIQDLIQRKRTQPEMGAGARIPVLDGFLQDCFAQGLASAEKMAPRSQHLWSNGDFLFQHILCLIWGSRFANLFP
jgi:uncharacterized protein